MENNFMARGRKKAVEAAPAAGGMNALMENKAAIAIILILIAAAYFVIQGGAPAGGPGATTTTAPVNIKTQGEAGKTISDLSSSAVDAGSVLRDIDNSIG